MTKIRPKYSSTSRSRWWLTSMLLLFIVAVVFGLVVYRLYLQRTWRNIGRFTLLRREMVEDKNRFSFVSIDPVSKEAVILFLPNDLEISTLEGRGEWRLSVMSEMAKRFGWKWVGDSIADDLGIAYLGFEQDLGIWDKISWKILSSKKQFKTVDLTDTSFLEKNDAVDGKKVLGLSTTWDDRARELFVSAGLVSESTNIRIVNSLGETGMGTHAARTIEHAGLRVGQIDNDSSTEVKKCELHISKPSMTHMFLQQVFGCDLKMDLDKNEIVLILGKEYRKRWLGR